MLYIKNGFKIEYKVIRKNNKNTYLRFKDDCLLITTNYFTSINKIESLIDSNFDIIIKKMQMMSKRSDPNVIYFFGNAYTKKIILNDFNKIEIDEINKLFLIYTKKNDLNYYNKIILAFFASSLDKEILKYKSFLDEYFNKDALIKYKPLKSAFGKNYFLKNEIIISSYLAKFSKEYIYYILAHEYVHFKYPDHQKSFHILLDIICPKNKELRKKLNKDSRIIKLNL